MQTQWLTLESVRIARSEKKPIEGVLLIDKPSGKTSHDVIDGIRRISGVKKVGHAGTLDPLATGLLIVLVGRAYTKRQPEFMHHSKTYQVTAQLGIETDTYDSDGKVVRTASWRDLKRIDRSDIEQLLPGFTGEIAQTVPPFSAVKRGGKKLYELARAGQLQASSELPTRDITIHELKLLDFWREEPSDSAKATVKSTKAAINEAESNTSFVKTTSSVVETTTSFVETAASNLFFSLELTCSPGTYVRSLVHDIGQKLAVGATVSSLRRTAIGEWHVSQAEPLPSL